MFSDKLHLNNQAKGLRSQLKQKYVILPKKLMTITIHFNNCFLYRSRHIALYSLLPFLCIKGQRNNRATPNSTKSVSSVNSLFPANFVKFLGNTISNEYVLHDGTP